MFNVCNIDGCENPRMRGGFTKQCRRHYLLSIGVCIVCGLNISPNYQKCLPCRIKQSLQVFVVAAHKPNKKPTDELSKEMFLEAKKKVFALLVNKSKRGVLLGLVPSVKEAVNILPRDITTAFNEITKTIFATDAIQDKGHRTARIVLFAYNPNA